jgi:hypothetical protein
MAFTTEVARVAEAIEDISIELFHPNPAGEEVAGATYSVQVRMSDGSIVVRTGDLVPHITVSQRNALLDFMATLRQQAIDQFLP